MVSLFDYFREHADEIRSPLGCFRPAILSALCDALLIPAEVKDEVLCRAAAVSETGDAENLVSRLLIRSEADGAFAEAKALYGKDENGFSMLTLMLAGAVRSAEAYMEDGIPCDIYLDTMRCFSRFLGESMESYGHYCFDRGFWVYRQLSRVICRIGQLEFERIAAGQDIPECSVKAGDPLLSIHIPSDAVMTRENLDDTYRRNKEFMREFYPNYHAAAVICHSWLMSPHLREILPDTSRILIFQSDFTVLKTDDDSDAYKIWIFKKGDLSPEDFPENTSLQRRAKAHILAGGKIGLAVAALRPGLAC